MEVNTNPELHDWVLDKLRAREEEPKPSPHSTQLIYCLTSSYYDLIDPLPRTEKEILMFAVGHGMERFMLDKTDDQPIKKDGVYMSPDFMMTNGESSWGELKTTRARPPGQGGKIDLPEGWAKQIMAYCLGLGVTEYNLSVIHVVQPVLSAWRLSFSQEELEDNWEWIKARLATLMEFMGQGIPPTPFKHNMEWECNWCRYKPRCDMARIGARGG